VNSQEPVVSMHGITKKFGGVTALDAVDLEAFNGEVIAIVGDNGAGKSTLIKILTGVYSPTAGHLQLDGKQIVLNSHAEAIEIGIDAVYQSLALAGDLDPPANLFLGNELTKNIFGFKILDNKKMRSETERVLMERFGTRLPNIDAPTESLSGGQRQAVAISRAIYDANLRVLVMDEPTAALGPRETERTLGLIKNLRDQGLAIVLISHSLDDVFKVADRIQVMRRGKKVGVLNVKDTTVEEVLGLIVGAPSAD
jgi:ABC-type sugar transport system ATPase subunit